MKITGFPAFSILIWLAMVIPAFGEAVKIENLKDGLLLGPHLRIFEDKAGTAKWEDVLAGKHDAEFKAQSKPVPNFGSTRSVIWAVVDLEFSALPSGEGGKRTLPPDLGKDKKRREYLFELSHPILDYVDMVVQDLKTGKIIHSWQTGASRPFTSRPVIHRNFILPINADSAVIRILLSVKSASTLRVPLKLWLAEKFYASDAGELVFHGIFFGIMLVMIIYNMIMASALKSLSGYFYSLYMFSYALFNLSNEGLLYQAMPFFEKWMSRAPSFFSAFAMIFASIFTYRFLNLQTSTRAYSRITGVYLLFTIFGLIIVSFGDYRAGLRITFVAGFVGPLMIMTFGFIRFYQNFRPARYFLIGFGVVICTTIIFVFSRSGLIPSDSFFVAHSQQFGGALEAILLSFGLADRIRLIQKEKEIAQAATIEQQRVLNEAFARFVPAPFLQILGKKSIPEVLLGDYTEREMTILFADIRGFTTISEKLSPKQTFDFINNYLQGSGPVIRNNGGFIDKYMGDGIMALFEKRADAINAAMRLQQRNARLNKMVGVRPPSPTGRGAGGEGGHRSGDPKKGLIAPINVGIGIHTGHLMLGTIGEPQRMDGTVISDAVNLASRVESLTKQYGVNLLVTKETLTGMKLGTSEFPYLRRFIDRIAVKGKSEPATVYEVIALKNGAPLKYTEKWLTHWSEALRLYYARDFSGAEGRLRDLAADYPEDQTLGIFRERCSLLQENPPLADWDGVAVAASK